MPIRLSELPGTLANLWVCLNASDGPEEIDGDLLISWSRCFVDSDQPLDLDFSTPEYEEDPRSRTTSDLICERLLRMRNGRVALGVWSSVVRSEEFMDEVTLRYGIDQVLSLMEDSHTHKASPLMCELVMTWCSLNPKDYNARSAARVVFARSSYPYTRRLLEALGKNIITTSLYDPLMTPDALSCLLRPTRDTLLQFKAVHYEKLSRVLFDVMELRMSAYLKKEKMCAIRWRAERNMNAVWQFFTVRKLMGPRLCRLWHCPLPDRAARLVMEFAMG